MGLFVKRNSRPNFELETGNRKNKERKKNLYLCFIDYCKAFDTVAHEVLWKNMIDMRFPNHIILLIETLYKNKTATVKTSYGLSDFFSNSTRSQARLYNVPRSI